MAARGSALRKLTRRGCPSAVNEVNVASSAAGHGAEYHRAVGRRPTAAVARRGLPGCGFAAPPPARVWPSLIDALKHESSSATG